MKHDEKKMLEQARQNLSANFDGQTPKKTNTKKMKTQKIRFEGKNPTDKNLKIALLPGTFNNIAEIQKVYPDIDAVITDGEVIAVGTKKVTFESLSPKTIEHFKNFFRIAGSRIINLDIVSNAKENFQSDISYVETSPFDERPGFEQVRLADYKSTFQNDNNRVVCEGVNIPLHPMGLVFFTFHANSTLDMTMDVQVPVFSI